jgi:hypothetical protein
MILTIMELADSTLLTKAVKENESAHDSRIDSIARADPQRIISTCPIETESNRIESATEYG